MIYGFEEIDLLVDGALCQLKPEELKEAIHSIMASDFDGIMAFSERLNDELHKTLQNNEHFLKENRERLQAAAQYARIESFAKGDDNEGKQHVEEV